MIAGRRGLDYGMAPTSSIARWSSPEPAARGGIRPLLDRCGRDDWRRLRATPTARSRRARGSQPPLVRIGAASGLRRSRSRRAGRRHRGRGRLARAGFPAALPSTCRGAPERGPRSPALARRRRGSVHPVRPFTGAQGEDWQGAFVAVEGDEKAVELASELSRAIGARPHRISAAAKPLYHAGASLAAGGAAAVLSVGVRGGRTPAFPRRSRGRRSRGSPPGRPRPPEPGRSPKPSRAPWPDATSERSPRTRRRSPRTRMPSRSIERSPRRSSSERRHAGGRKRSAQRFRSEKRSGDRRRRCP